MAIFSGIAAAVAAVGTAVAGVFTASAAAAFVLRTVATIGLSLALNALSGKKQDQPQGFGVQGKLAGGGDVPRAALMGLSATAGSLVYAGTWGQSGKTPNAYLTQVIAVSDVPVNGLVAPWINGVRTTVLWNETRQPQGWPIEQYRKNGKDHCWIEFFDGTQTTASSFLVEAFGSAENAWTSSRVGRGVAYAVVTCLVAEDLWTGFPAFQFECNGMKLYDPSRDSTVGGSGAHRWGDPSTWGGDGDHLPAVQLYNLLRGIRWNGAWLYGLQNLPAARLPASDWIAAINKCRATVEGMSGDEPTYRAGGQLSVNVQLANAVNALVTACHGRLAEIGGVYKLRCGAPGEPVISFDDGAILSSAEQSFTPFLGLSQTINGIAARYPSPADGWTPKVAPPLYRSDFEAQDGGRRLMADLSFELVPYGAQVQRLMSSALEEARRARRHTLVLPPEFFVLEPGDTIAWTSGRNFYETKLFRVDGLVDRANLDVLVDVTEVDPADYDPPSAGYRPEPAGTITTVSRVAPQALVDFDAIPITIEATVGLSKPGIRILWNGENQEDIFAVEFQIWNATASSLISQGATAPSTVRIGFADIDASIVANKTYQVRGRFVPDSARQTDWTDYIEVTTDDVRADLNALTAAVQRAITDAIAQAKREAQDQLDRMQLVIQDLEEQVASNRFTETKRVESVRETGVARLVEAERVLVEADQAAAERLEGLEASVNNPSTGLVATRATLTSFQSTQATFNSATSSNLLSLAASLTALDGTVSGNSSAIGVLQASVVTINGTLTSQATQITSLQSGLTTANSNITANATAIGTLTTRVTSAEGSITSQSGQITSLTNSLTTTNGTVAANSSAISTLQSNVSSINGTLSSYASQLTTLNAQVGSLNSSVTTIANATVNPSGSSALWAVQLNAAGRVSGVRSFNNGAVATFGVSADIFTINRPSDGAVVLGWDGFNNVLSIFGATFIAGRIANVSTGDWKLEIDLNYPRIRVRDPATGLIALVIGETG